MYPPIYPTYVPAHPCDCPPMYLPYPCADLKFFASGGGGLAGTVADYVRFATCLLNGGELEGTTCIHYMVY